MAKVMVVVAEVLPGGELKLAGLGIAHSNGLKRGVVVNISSVSAAGNAGHGTVLLSTDGTTTYSMSSFGDGHERWVLLA